MLKLDNVFAPFVTLFFRCYCSPSIRNTNRIYYDYDYYLPRSLSDLNERVGNLKCEWLRALLPGSRLAMSYAVFFFFTPRFIFLS